MKIGEKEFTLATGKIETAKEINKDISALIYKLVDKYLNSISEELDKYESLKVDVKISIHTEGEDEQDK